MLLTTNRLAWSRLVCMCALVWFYRQRFMALCIVYISYAAHRISVRLIMFIIRITVYGLGSMQEWNEKKDGLETLEENRNNKKWSHPNDTNS